MTLRHCASPRHWHAAWRAKQLWRPQGSRLLFPKQFAVGVLDSILSMSPFFGCHVRPLRISVLSILYICLPSWGSDARPLRISVLSTLYVCLLTWVVMSALFGSLCPRFITFVSQLGSWCPPVCGYLCSQFLQICHPAWVVVSALVGSLCSHALNSSHLSPRPGIIVVFAWAVPKFTKIKWFNIKYRSIVSLQLFGV